MNDMIRITQLTKDYGNNCGVFDISLAVRRGEAFGLVGINGAGKTTLIRHLMGFLKPQKGSTRLMGEDSWRHAAGLKKRIGYIPGEIAFPEVYSGVDFFKLQAAYLGIKNLTRVNDLTERFNLDATAKLKSMSKGMKQKTAIVAAFMADPDLFILDEPTTGLDPLMQKAFSDVLREQKARGKTVFMSSHMFDELEGTCDRVAFLKEGRIIDIVSMSEIQGRETVKEYEIKFVGEGDYLAFLQRGFTVKSRKDRCLQVNVRIPDHDIGYLLRELSRADVCSMSQNPYTLEAYFKDKYLHTEVAHHD